MAAYRQVYDWRHLQADYQEPGSAPEPYARYSSMATFIFYRRRLSCGNPAEYSASQSTWEERMHGTVVGYNFKLQRVAATDLGVMQRKLHLVYTYSYSGQKSLSITKNSFTDSTNQIAVFA